MQLLNRDGIIGGSGIPRPIQADDFDEFRIIDETAGNSLGFCDVRS